MCANVIRLMPDSDFSCVRLELLVSNFSCVSLCHMLLIMYTSVCVSVFVYARTPVRATV